MKPASRSQLKGIAGHKGANKREKLTRRFKRLEERAQANEWAKNANSN